MQAQFVTLDVFTDMAFAGNPLAVLPDARGLDDASMHAVAREFNYSETTFVLPARTTDAVRRVRIFTPMGELPFAGHPVVGTAIALVRGGYIPMDGERLSFVFDLDAGPTPVTVRRDGERLEASFTAPKPPTIGRETDPRLVAAAVGLDVEAINTSAHLPVDAGTGLDFVAVRLRDLDALANVRPDMNAWADLPSPAAGHGLVLYVPVGDNRLRVRMFGPGVGVLEDPATGSAAAALIGLLATLDARTDDTFIWRIAQGVEMGRPSEIDVAVDKHGGAVTTIRITGTAVPVMEGVLNLPDA